MTGRVWLRTASSLALLTFSIARSSTAAFAGEVTYTPPPVLHRINDNMMASENAATRYWDRFLGVAGPNDPRLSALSPIDHVDAVTVPVLLIHGHDDTVVPYAQSEKMAEALQRAGRSVQLVSLPHEDHWLSQSATREQMLDAIVSFLGRNDPPN